VESVNCYVRTLRPLAEWTGLDRGRGQRYVCPDDWLVRITPYLNDYKARSMRLLRRVVLAPQMFVTQAQLWGFLADAGKDAYVVRPEVTSNLMNFCRFRSECNRSCFFLFF
jgi:hypothetical protein